jgi:hypothetical protein
MDLPGIWRSVDAVVLAKAIEIKGARCKAGVLELFRRHLGGPKTEVVLEAPVKAGDEFVAFLRWNSSARIYSPRVLLPVRNGKVHTAAIDGLPPDMDLEAFLTRLRSMQE